MVDLILPEANAFELIQFTQNEPSLRSYNISALIMSSHNSEENVRESYERGARDYLTRPIVHQDLLNRVIFHCRDSRIVENTESFEKISTEHLKIANLVVTQSLQKLSFEDMLYNFTQMGALKVKGLRCNIVYSVTNDKGIVLASNDKRNIAGLNLDLKKYPEIQLVVNAGKMVVIDNLSESRALSSIKENFKDISFNSMIVGPIYYRHKIFGVISIRMPDKKQRISEIDINFIDFLSKVISLYMNTQPAETLGKYALFGMPS
ncbi:MAG: hypothetical protein A2Z20_01350 [Bdellovibrionales bacterium RBG_16_40_8]|nr:MAG: hypothetical protein A2Z20_01350 [Bdellovibrionales bacterium RBG_16_40_8]